VTLPINDLLCSTMYKTVCRVPVPQWQLLADAHTMELAYYRKAMLGVWSIILLYKLYYAIDFAHNI